MKIADEGTASPALRDEQCLERRAKRRYPVQLNVRYRSVCAPPIIGGSGRIVNMSSGGALILSEDGILPGTRIQASIEWPFLLDGRTPLQILASGTVVRSGSATFAVAFEHYLFHTSKRPSELAATQHKRQDMAATNGG